MFKYLQPRYLIQVRFGIYGDWHDYHRRCWTLRGARHLRWHLINRDTDNALPFWRIYDTQKGYPVE
jgi:hypothetical protein